MRRKAGSWVIKAILFAIVVVFVFWGWAALTTVAAAMWPWSMVTRSRLMNLTSPTICCWTSICAPSEII